MANKGTTNPIFIDAAGTDVLSKEWQFVGIVVVPSADSWAIELQDSNGDPIYKNSSTVANYRPAPFVPATPIFVTGLNVTTLTNITHALVYIQG